jgi:hypothetical protein
MNDLIALLVSIITTIGLAILILALSEVVINGIPRLLMLAQKSDGIQLAQDKQQSIADNKTGSCPFC